MVGFMTSLSSATLRINPAYAAALALVAIQVSIGILFKAAQTDGQYSFSASSSVTISEFLKFLLASVFFYRECAAKHVSSPRLPSEVPVDLERDEEKQASTEDGEDQAFLKSAEKVANKIGKFRTRGMAMDLKTFYGYVLDELPSETRYGFAMLALFYVLINNTVFLQYKLSDPGTIQLIKSGTTLITAVVSLGFLGTKVARGQWLAIALQVCGIVVTQYKPSGATYALSTYLVLLFATTISAVSSVYNQKLCKSVDASMHVMNMSLYSAGAAINLLLHVVTRFIKPDEPGFFTGYGNIGAILVIISNVLIGLAMTAVYKYADAIIKCFATAMSTAILLYISPVLFGVDMSFLVLPGTSVVFIATWLYMEATPPKSSTPAPEAVPTNPEERSVIGKVLYMLSPYGPLRKFGLGGATVVTLIVISSLTSWEARNNSKQIQDEIAEQTPLLNITAPAVPKNVLESPFKNTMAYVRWNSKHEERIPLIRNGYEPFFHTMHYSMPQIVGEGHADFVNLTHDAWEDGYWGYRAVKNTMQVILDETTEDEIDGIMFFHFDVWVDPLGFAEMDYDKIWFPDSEDPKLRCMKNTERYKEWWGWGVGFHEKALQATRFAANLHGKYKIDADEWCVG
jgi:UDP-galactose transporter